MGEIGETVLRQLVLPQHQDSALAVLREGMEKALSGEVALAPVSREAALPDTVPSSVAAVITTSGSTGRPKMTALGHKALQASAAGTETALGGPGSWLLALPPDHVSGFQVVARAVRSGSDVVCVGTSAGFTPRAFCEAARRLPPGRRYVSLVPTQLKRLLAHPGACDELGRFDGVLVGGAGLDPATDERARKVAAIRTTYGMTETCGGCVYDGIALDGVRVRLVGDEVHLGGPVLAESYLGDGGSDTPFYEDTEGRWFRTADRGRWDNGRLIVEGRVDDMINTGGMKVPAGVVDGCIESHPEVTASHTTAVPDSEWGEIVASYVCVTPGSGLSPEQVRVFVKERLEHHFAPKSVLVTDDPPLLPNGKLDQLRIRGLLTAEEE